MALIAPAMSLQVSVSDVAARIQQSQNGLILNLPVSLNVPIVELLDALQSVQKKNGEPLPESKVAPPQELAPGIQPPPNRAPDMPPPPMSGVEVEPPISFWLPRNFSNNAEWFPLHGLGSCRPGSTYSISSSRQNCMLRDEDLELLGDMKVTRLEPVPPERKAPTPKVPDLAAEEARAEEAFKKAMEEIAAKSSKRAPPEYLPPPAGFVDPRGSTNPALNLEHVPVVPPSPPPRAASPGQDLEGQHGSTQSTWNTSGKEKDCKTQ